MGVFAGRHGGSGIEFEAMITSSSSVHKSVEEAGRLKESGVADSRSSPV